MPAHPAVSSLHAAPPDSITMIDFLFALISQASPASAHSNAGEDGSVTTSIDSHVSFFGADMFGLSSGSLSRITVSAKITLKMKRFQG